MFNALRQGAVFVVTGDEPLHVESVDVARAALSTCLQKRQPKIVFDLEQIPLVDSAGLELLTSTRRECMRRGGVLQLARPNHLTADILRMTGLDGQFNIFDSVRAGVGSFAR
jgi:anti-anti-sigma factor